MESLGREIERARTATSGAPTAAGAARSAVILASPELATWADDEAFMAQLLRRLGSHDQLDAAYAGEGPAVDVLFGVTQGLSPSHLLGQPRKGLSVLYSNSDSLLPSIWQEEPAAGPRTSPDRAATVAFTGGPATSAASSLGITLPLANTIFQNGRRSTLLASQWQPSSGRWTPNRMAERQRQEIACLQGRNLRPHIPLVPLTPPRKIVAGLGNIVRQIGIDGDAAPASQELEELIPGMYARRWQKDDAQAPAPMGVWAWVIPPHVVESGQLAGLRAYQQHSDEGELSLALEAAGLFDGLLSSRCRLHKIRKYTPPESTDNIGADRETVSGGGGWGAKKGLLSLDPETNYTAPEEEDVEMFIKAFQERGSSGDASEGIVTPGHYLLFCAEPQLVGEAAAGPVTPPFSLGVAPNPEQWQLGGHGQDEAGEGRGETLAGCFSATSSTGLYLKGESGFSTKIDVPRASFLASLSASD